ncbi:hypothetical protein H5410_027614 [Solanum commersonii]|uniref:DUF4283 domain-containing protein n=1 Tax=Solanum commersonii TaxID=4109 RepID=A0A9J5Z0C8_SOLCO|nr:hypothetical protein H5410_027614 [Solanum commersonii]
MNTWDEGNNPKTKLQQWKRIITKERNSNWLELQHDHANLSTKETIDGNVHGKMQGNQNVVVKQTQAAPHTNAKEQTEASKEKQYGNGVKATWKVRDKTKPNKNTMQQNKEYGRKQPNNTNKEKTGKSVNFAPNNYGHNFPPYNNLNSSQNEHEKGQSLVQTKVNGQSEKITPKGHDMDPKIPPPIKVSSNFDAYRPSQQRNNQNSPKHTQSKPLMLGKCKYTLVGKFTNAMPKMEVIRRSFIVQTQLTGVVKIAHFNSRHIYIDLDNEADHISVWKKMRIFIVDHLMKLQVWTLTFKPTEETPIVPIWITLPELPWYCYYMDILTPLLSPIGKALYLDSTTMQKTRGSVAKVTVQIDITKERPQHVWLGFSEKDPFLGKWQIIEFEDVPPYCLYCKHQGHILGECPTKERDEEIKKRKKQNQDQGKNHNPQVQVQQAKTFQDQ